MSLFQAPEVLDPAKHAHLTYRGNVGYAFAREEIAVPLVASEITTAARDYALVFDSAKPAAYALLGVEQGRNAYINAAGRWLGRYRPAAIRAYPFTLKAAGQSEQGNTRYAILVDMAAPQLAGGGQALFDDGKPSELLEKIQGILTSLEKERLRLAALVEQLDHHGLLVARSLNVESRDIAVGGFRLVDAEALAALSPEALAELRDSGALMLAYAQLLSQANLKDGPIAQAASAPQGPLSIDELFGEGDDDFTFDFDS